LIKSLAEERGAALVYFPEVHDKFRYELPKNEKLMFLLRESPELEVNEEQCYVAHAKVRTIPCSGLFRCKQYRILTPL